MDRDDLLRAACFLALDALRAKLGDELPYRGAIDQKFVFDGRDIAFMNPQKGIHRARQQRGPAALSLLCSCGRPGRAPGLPQPWHDNYGWVQRPDRRWRREALRGA